MKLALVISLAMVLILAGCGGGSSASSSDVAGNWAATLTNSAGTTVYAFNTTLTQTSTNTAGGVTGTYAITNSSTCFEEFVSESGMLTIGSSANTLTLTIVGGQPGALSLDTLQMAGTVSGKTITGTWTLTGFGSCNGSGPLTMTKS